MVYYGYSFLMSAQGDSPPVHSQITQMTQIISA